MGSAKGPVMGPLRIRDAGCITGELSLTCWSRADSESCDRVATGP